MATLSLLLSPNLKTASLKVSKILEEMVVDHGLLFLSLPVELENALTDFTRETLSYEEFIDVILEKRFMPEPRGSWEYALRPVLEVLPGLCFRYPGFRVFCYGSSEFEFASMRVASELMRLTLRVSLTGDVDTDEWRSTMNESLDLDEKAEESEVRNIAQRAQNRLICLSDMSGSRLKRPLREIGLDVSVRYVVKPYVYIPLTVLKRKLARGSVGDSEVERLVRCHVDYVRNHIYRFENRDRAYYEWVWDKVPWIREKIDREEFRILESVTGVL